MTPYPTSSETSGASEILYSYENHSDQIAQVTDIPGDGENDQTYSYNYNLSDGCGDASDPSAGTLSGLIAVATSTLGNDASTSTTYCYDALNRLTAAVDSGGGDDYWDYSYDSDGNVCTATSDLDGTVTTTDYGYNPGDELTAIGGDISCTATSGGDTTPTYDADGNTLATSDADGALDLTYNDLNQTSLSGDTYAYLGADQDRIVNDGDTIAYNQLGVDSITDADDHTTHLTYSANGQLLDEQTPSATYYYTYDGHGNITGLIDSSSDLATTYTYDPYGDTITTGGSAPDTTNYFGYDAGLKMPGTDLYHFGARYYDPSLARWTQPDPLASGLVADPVQADSYQFTGDDPVNEDDLAGECFIVSCGVYHVVESAAEGGVTGAFEGAVTGFLVGGPPGAAAGALEGAGTGAVTGALTGIVGLSHPKEKEELDTASYFAGAVPVPDF